jgi:hypothetical protein
MDKRFDQFDGDGMVVNEDEIESCLKEEIDLIYNELELKVVVRYHT